ncbi:hypothetical protein B566_EDAN016845 [Ephemera danica]|nr:hypothetical protein B566_EDAN016845 [Ephemera danica]
MTLVHRHISPSTTHDAVAARGAVVAGVGARPRNRGCCEVNFVAPAFKSLQSASARGPCNLYTFCNMLLLRIHADIELNVVDAITELFAAVLTIWYGTSTGNK